MDKSVASIAGRIAGIAMLLSAAPVMAHGNAQWSITVGTPSYYYAPPPVVVYPQSQYIYGAPPSVTYVPPPVLYVQPQPLYQQNAPTVRYGDPYSSHGHSSQGYYLQERHHQHGHGDRQPRGSQWTYGGSR